jgi:hypothetical protein
MSILDSIAGLFSDPGMAANATAGSPNERVGDAFAALRGNPMTPAPSNPLPYIPQGSIPGLMGTSGTLGMWGVGGVNPVSSTEMNPSAPFNSYGMNGETSTRAENDLKSIPPNATMDIRPEAPVREVRGSDAPGQSLAPEQAGNLTNGVPRGPTNGPGTDLLPKGSLLDRLFSWRDNNRMTLLALAGGLAGSQSIGQGIGRGFTAAAAAAPLDRQYAIQNQTAQYLASRGLPPELAMAAASNPAVMGQMLPFMMGVKPWTMSSIKLADGTTLPIAVDPTNPNNFKVIRPQMGQKSTTQATQPTSPQQVYQQGGKFYVKGANGYQQIGP